MFGSTQIRVIALAALVLTLGCDRLQSPNVNSSDLTELTENPTRKQIGEALTGLLAGNRSYFPQDAAFVTLTGILGRNALILDPSEPRFITELLEGRLSAGSVLFGGNLWAQPYENIRLSEIVLNAVASAPGPELTEGERAASRGLAKTSRAFDLLMVVNTRDTNCGCPIEVPEDASNIAPSVDKRAVFDEIVRLLEEGAADLEQAAAADAGFVNPMPSGYQDFATPAAYLEFNRALAARVFTYMGRDFDPSFWNDALVALEESFLDPSEPMDFGVFHNFGTGSGDLENQLFEPSATPDTRAHPSVGTDAQIKENGEPDDRFQRKVREVNERQLRGVGSSLAFDIYTSPSAPIPIIRNEELFLLRAEANIGLGNLEVAREDINFVRENSGGLPPVEAFPGQEEAIDQLLLEKRYSLLFEGGHRWIDLRRWDRIERLPLDQPDHVRNERFPVPIEETVGR